MSFFDKNPRLRRFLMVGMMFVFVFSILLLSTTKPAFADEPTPETDERESSEESNSDDEPGSEGTLFEDENPGTPASWDFDLDDDIPAHRVQSAAPSDCLGNPNRNVRYTSDGVIHVEGCGESFTLTDVAASRRVTTDMLELVDAENKIWLLKVKMKVKEGATLNVIGGNNGDANWLRLRSDDSSGVWLKGINGNLRFEDTKVTSWDLSRNDYDRDHLTEGRSYVSARSQWTDGRETAPATACDVNGGTQEPYEGRLDIINSEMAYLGYYSAEAYGVAWKVYAKSNNPPPGRELYDMVDIFGTVRDSIFHHNYFGTYTFGAYCINWTNNIFEHNIEYGLDPHDDSDYLVIEDNIFRHNGNHGLICSKYCNNLIIRNNVSHNNRNGIMLHRYTDDSLVENNHSYDNRDSGIAIFDSHRNTVINNRFENNGRAAVRFSVGASENLIADNILLGLDEDLEGNGYAIFGYQGSDLPIAGDGRPKHNVIRDNQITSFKSPMIKWKEATENRFERNVVSGIANVSLTAYEFRPGYGNIVDTPIFEQDDDITTHFRTAVRTDELSLPSAWTYLRDLQVGKELKIKLHSFSDSRTILEDTRNLIWMSSHGFLSTSAQPSISTLELTFDLVGGTEPITTLDFAVVPSSGTVEVTPMTWKTSGSYQKAWREESSSTSDPVVHTVGDLQPNRCYQVTANNNLLDHLSANSNGQISFTYSGGYEGPVDFAVNQATACTILNNEVGLTHKIYIPFVIK